MSARNIIRWLHLSDFHIGKDEHGQRQLLNYLLDHIASVRKPDLIFLTGDISQSGVSEQFDIFYEQFLCPLLESLAGTTRIFCIPGNHDIDRTRAPLVSRQAIKQKAPDFFDPNKHGLKQRREVNSRLDAYREMDQLYLDHSDWLDSEAGCFTCINKIRGVEIGILGLNTAWLSEGEKEKENLTPGKPIVEMGLKAIEQTKVRIVIGHHPLDWFDPTDAQRISALFGKHRIIYLHGHMHKTSARVVHGAGHAYLNIQCGAAFQARESDIWVNGFCWGEFDISSDELELEPYHWNTSNQEWVHDMDAFPYVYRIENTTKFKIPFGPQKVLSKSQAKVYEPPAGWDQIDRESLRLVDRNPDEKIILRYFDGRIPTFGIALSKGVPRRQIVDDISQKFKLDRDSGNSTLCVILGAGGEGKSTALLQSIEALLEAGPPGMKVLWRKGDGATLTQNTINALQKDSGGWLIVSDDADLIGESAYRIASGLESEGRHDISFLFAARHSDWRNINVTPAHWERLKSYNPLELKGINLSDAKIVVKAWSDFGDKGLGKLSGLDPEQAASRLVDESRREESSDDGAFFGALLRLRLGEDLKSHVKRLLDRLQGRKIFPHRSTTLLEAFAYIAAMHAENKLFLTKIVLSNVLDVEEKQLRSKVLWPLGEEAAADVAGDFVFTRHRAIAEVAVDILKNTLYYEIELSDVYADLVRSARHVFSNGMLIYGVAEWKFLSEYFFSEKNERALGIKLAQTVVQFDVTDAHARVKLASMYRRIDQPINSLRIFRESPKTELRGFFNEWATAEFDEGNFAIAAWLTATALSDEIARPPPDNKTIGICLANFARACKALYEGFNDAAYLPGVGAAGKLGQLAVGRSKEDYRNFKASVNFSESLGVIVSSANDFTRYMHLAVSAAYGRREAELPNWLPLGTDLTFHGMAQVLGIESRPSFVTR